MLGLPAGAAGGILAGSQTMSAAIGTAEMAVTQGAYKIPDGTTAEQVTAMIALGYGVTYIWGTVGIILICKYLPRWWGLDARKAAKRVRGRVRRHECGRRRPHRATARAACAPIAWRTRRSPGRASRSSASRIRSTGSSMSCATARSSAPIRPRRCRPATSSPLGGKLEDLTANLGLIGPEVPDSAALSIPLDQAEILVLNKDIEDRALKDFRQEDFAGQMQVMRLERSGEPIPVGAETKLQRFDVLFVAGLKSAVDKAVAKLGKVARPSTSTDLLTLSVGMVLGLLIGQINVPVGDFSVGLGNAGGLLLSGILVSSVVSRLRFFGSTPNAARNILEDLGLVTFIAIVGINAGATLLEQLTGDIARQDLPRRLHRQHDPADRHLGDRLPPHEDQPGGADGRRRRRALALGTGARSVEGDRQQRALGRVPGRLCGVRRAVYGLRLLRDGAFAVMNGCTE